MVTKKSSKKKASKKKTTTTSSKQDDDTGKICAILQYFFPIGLIWYLVDETMKKNSFVKFHLKQSLVLVIVSIALNILFTILPFLLIIGWLLHLGLFVLWVMGLIYSIQGQEKEVPLIGKFASHFNF